MLGAAGRRQRRRARRPARRRLGPRRCRSDGDEWQRRALADRPALAGDAGGAATARTCDLLRQRRDGRGQRRVTLDLASLGAQRGRRQADAAHRPRRAYSEPVLGEVDGRRRRRRRRPARGRPGAGDRRRRRSPTRRRLRERDPRQRQERRRRCRCSWRVERGGQRARARRDAGGGRRRRQAASAASRPSSARRRRWCRCATASFEGLTSAVDADLGGVGADGAHARQDADRRGLAEEPERAAHDRRLRRPVGAASASRTTSAFSRWSA